jgi:hypothetical protein
MYDLRLVRRERILEFGRENDGGQRDCRVRDCPTVPSGLLGLQGGGRERLCKLEGGSQGSGLWPRRGKQRTHPSPHPSTSEGNRGRFLGRGRGVHYDQECGRLGVEMEMSRTRRRAQRRWG